MADTNVNVMEVTDLKKHFPIRSGLLRKQVGAVKAVDGIDLQLKAGKTLGLVGESGCGKSTLGRLLVQLLAPTEGSIKYRGQEMGTLKGQDKWKVKKDLQMIFQDPFSSLNPRQKIGDILEEPFRIHGRQVDGELVQTLLEKVGLDPRYAQRYPHEFSGGQRQRIGIARALALNPGLIVCDEPVSALDVSIQAQIINLLEDLQGEYGMSYLFIAHDLGVVKHISHEVGVMYLGNLVEKADVKELYENPQHPYTKVLLSSIPISHPSQKQERIILKGEIPSPINPPQGCKFHPRCPYAESRCREEVPVLRGDTKHQVACHLV